MANITTTSALSSRDIAQNLVCPICLSTLSEPKLLSCGHTFCLKCIANLVQGDTNAPCPLCRQVTFVENGDVSNLQTNFILQPVLEAVNETQDTCGLCDTTKLVKELVFCYDCCIHVCEKCRQKHDEMGENKNHAVLINQPDVTCAKERHCFKHAGEICTNYCIQCKLMICRKCRPEHEKMNHEVRRSVSYTYGLYLKTNLAKEHIRGGFRDFQKYTDLFSSLQRQTEVRTSGLISCIEREHEEILSKLEERKTSLVKICHDVNNFVKNAVSEETQRANNGRQILENAGTMVHSMALLGIDELTTYDEECDSIIEKLSSLGEGHALANARYHKIKDVIDNLNFEKNCQPSESYLGDINTTEWLTFETNLQCSKSMSCMDINPKGEVAVGYCEGGIELLKADGTREIVAEDILVMALAFMTKGGFVLRTMDNSIVLYDAKHKKEQISFEYENFEKGGYGDVAVDCKNNIYASYRNVRMVYVYSCRGGKALMKIECNDMRPNQIAVLAPKSVVVMGTSTLKLVGCVMNGAAINRPGFIGYPAVAHDGGILVAWLKPSENIISVTKYDKQLPKSRFHNYWHPSSST